ncbi:apolipoprotein D-like [Brevipalpus obovatus]|uniref:apolipoprotein D-like n=1 Tax=Brevipalpus obovatus TaxID=246614 RepID=UPI003D9F6942
MMMSLSRSVNIIVLLGFYLTICSGQEFARGACPEVTPPAEGSNWNLSKYLGVWYEIARTENIWEIGLKCVTANYTLRSDGVIRVDNKGITERNKTVNAVGSARIDSPVNLLKVKFAKWSPEAPYWIAKTDFDRYALVISCMDLFNALKVESAWILSRTPTLDQRIKEDLFNTLSSLGVPRSSMRIVNQNNCPY